MMVVVVVVAVGIRTDWLVVLDEKWDVGRMKRTGRRLVEMKFDVV